MTFATKFDESNVNGKAGLTRFSPPFYTFEINVDQLDADRYMPKTEAKKQPEQPLDLSALKGLNATGSVRIGSRGAGCSGEFKGSMTSLRRAIGSDPPN